MGIETLVAVSLWLILPLVIVGSLLHFLYDWTGHNKVAAIFGAVNESYWEHIKIAVWPVALLQFVLFSLGGYRQPSFVPAATIALFSIPISMIGLIYLYKSVTKKNILWIDISVFAASIALAQVLFVQVLLQLAPDELTIALSALFLLGLMASFLLFTIRPPEEPDIFIDPLTSVYGLPGHAQDTEVHLGEPKQPLNRPGDQFPSGD